MNENIPALKYMVFSILKDAPLEQRREFVYHIMEAADISVFSIFKEDESLKGKYNNLGLNYKWITIGFLKIEENVDKYKIKLTFDILNHIMNNPLLMGSGNCFDDIFILGKEKNNNYPNIFFEDYVIELIYKSLKEPKYDFKKLRIAIQDIDWDEISKKDLIINGKTRSLWDIINNIGNAYVDYQNYWIKN